MLLVEKTVVFYAAHSVRAFGISHKCARLHGHTYTLTVWVETSIDRPVEFSVVEQEVRGLPGTIGGFPPCPYGRPVRIPRNIN
jgi:6-pyruvoyl-tetrahydropterin synthase